MRQGEFLSGIALAAIMAAIQAGSAAAQTAAVAVPSQEASDSEEIVVTAQRRTQRLEDVPMSLSVATGQDLETERATNVDNLARFVPNLQTAGLTALQPQLTIRGIGTNDRQAGSDQSVVVFVDEQYIGRSSATVFSLLDVDRIEVLRGPQGTLFGRNVSGGAISVVTNRPTHAFEGMVSASVGNLGLLETQAVVNVPISQGVAIRAAGSLRTRNGYYRNAFLNNRRVGDRDSAAGRIQALFEPSSDLKILLAFEGFNDTIDGVGSKLIRGPNVSDAAYNTEVGPFDLAANPFVFPTSRPFDVANNRFGTAEASGVAGRARLEWDAGSISLIALLGVRENNLEEDYDAVGIPIIGTGPASRGFNSSQITDEDYTAYNAEVRLQGNDPTSPIQWVVGANYLREDIGRDLVLVRQLNNGYAQPRFDQFIAADSYGLFGDITWEFLPRVELTVGARYTIDKKSFDLTVSDTLSAAERAEITTRLGRAPNLAPATGAFAASTDVDWKKLTPRVALRFEPIDGLSFYGLWSRGYKSGGFFGTPATALAAITGFDPETVDNREIGARVRLAGGKVHFSVSAFDMRFRDLQVMDRFTIIPGDLSTQVNQVTNAAQAKIRGVEADFRIAPVRNLLLTGSLGLLDTRITETYPGSTLLVGAPLPKAPESTANLAAQYTIPVGPDSSVAFRGSWHHEGENYLDSSMKPASLQDAFSTFDASIRFEHKKWALTAWAKNLTDARYLTSASSFPGGVVAVVQYGEPRTYGLTASVRF